MSNSEPQIKTQAKYCQICHQVGKEGEKQLKQLPL